ncbi:hypothetical protein M8J77_017296 [Diaphorina citri]|nr:hypothetical protein M8J77_017296 [Diaphorina citri]
MQRQAMKMRKQNKISNFKSGGVIKPFVTRSQGLQITGGPEFPKTLSSALKKTPTRKSIERSLRNIFFRSGKERSSYKEMPWTQIVYVIRRIWG